MPVADMIRQLATKANAPLVRRQALQKAFTEPPKEWRALPRYYIEHLKQVFSDPKKMMLALTDITPLSLLTTGLTIPATAKLLKRYPDRRTETAAGFLGNILGGQVMQRTGIFGGLLGSLGGEAIGRTLAMPFTRGAAPVRMTLSNQLSRMRSAPQRIDQALGTVQQGLGVDKLGAESMFGPGGSDGVNQHNPETTESNIGGTIAELQEHPGQQQRSRDFIANRGKPIAFGDTLGEVIRLIGTGTWSHRLLTDPFGLHTEPDSLENGPTPNTIGNGPALSTRRG